jgi:hypothetical protein
MDRILNRYVDKLDRAVRFFLGFSGHRRTGILSGTLPTDG